MNIVQDASAERREEASTLSTRYTEAAYSIQGSQYSPHNFKDLDVLNIVEVSIDEETGKHREDKGTLSTGNVAEAATVCVAAAVAAAA